MELKNQGKTVPLLVVLGKVLEEFWGNFPLFHAIFGYITLFSRYIMLFYAILRYFTLIFDSMTIYLRPRPSFFVFVLHFLAPPEKSSKKS